MGREPVRIELPGITEELREDIDQRVTEFEQDHEASVLRNGPGWVPRIRGVDYAIAIGVNVVLVVWLVIVLAGG